MSPTRPTTPPPSPAVGVAVRVAGVALLALVGCAPGADPLAPEPPVAPAAAPMLALEPEQRASLGEALRDAAARLAPALDGARGAPLGAALARLRAAVDAGEARPAADALRAVRALLADGAERDDADAADRAAVGMVTDLVAAALAPRGEP